MGSLAGFLRLTDPSTGRCVELFNGARTLSHLREGRAASMWHEHEGPNRWPDVDCWAFDEGGYEDGSNPDPWYDPAVPATSEVSGFLPDAPGSGLGFRLEAPTSSRAVTASGKLPTEMFVTGTVVALTQRGEQAYLDWLQRVLADRCADGRGWMATVLSHCPCQKTLGPFVTLEDGFVAPLTDPQAPALPVGVCDPAPPVLDPFAGNVVEHLDDGFRHLLGIRFRGMDELTDQPTFPGCAGRRFQLRFEVDHPAWFSQPKALGTLGGLGAFDVCETLTSPFRICPGSTSNDGCEPSSTFTRRRRSSIQTAQYIRPRCFMRDVLLTPPQTELATRLQATVVNGQKDVHNVALRVWRAIDGIPSPYSEEGHNVYRQIDPVWEALIPTLGRGEQLTLDGRTSRAVLTCADGTTHSRTGLVEGPNGTPWSPSPFSCGDRYWISLDLSAAEASRGDMDVTATLSTYTEEMYG